MLSRWSWSCEFILSISSIFSRFYCSHQVACYQKELEFKLVTVKSKMFSFCFSFPFGIWLRFWSVWKLRRAWIFSSDGENPSIYASHGINCTNLFNSTCRLLLDPAMYLSQEHGTLWNKPSGIGLFPYCSWTYQELFFSKTDFILFLSVIVGHI